MELVHGIFVDGFPQYVVTFGVDDSSSKYSKNRKNNFLILGVESTDKNNDGFGESWEII